MIYGKNIEYVWVKNRLNSWDEDPSDGSSSWKEFWERKSGKKFDKCACKGCSRSATDGSHVIKVESEDRANYIVPLCHKCNEKTESFEVDEDLLEPVSDD